MQHTREILPESQRPMSIEELRSSLSLGAPARPGPSGAFGIVVAIPACNEEHRIAECLSALAIQRQAVGAPLRRGTFEVVVFANNCTDRTADVVRDMEDRLPFRLHLEESRLPPALAHAGGARKAAMDLAAERLAPYGPDFGLILTTDADSRVAATWIAAHLAGFRRGIDALAGYVDPDASEYVALGRPFVERGRLEDTYLSALAEIDALCDPRAHDPWPNHRVASGASLAVTLGAYRAIGGLPPVRLGEDAALARVLERGGFRLRHALDAVVTTSCRFDGRAAGGAADTMRLRHADPDAVCGEEVEPAAHALRRSSAKGRLRRRHDAAALRDDLRWARSLTIDPIEAAALAVRFADRPFAQLWEEVEARSRVLSLRVSLRPSGLAAETVKAERIIARLRARKGAPTRSADRADTSPAELRVEPAIA